MIEVIITGVVVPLLAHALDRIRYGRQIKKATAVIAKTIPNKTARQIAEQAVIAANQKEIERAMGKLLKAQAEHQVRLAAIKAGGGDVNVGNLK